MNTTATLLLVDLYCWNLDGRVALDGAVLDAAPVEHTVHCMRDVEVCRQGGFGLLRQSTTSRYELAYVFNSDGAAAALEVIDATSAKCGLTVTVTGTVDDRTAPPTLVNAVLTDAGGGAACGALAPMLLAHAILMSLGWTLLAVGILVSAVGKRGPCADCAPWWFKVHVVLNTAGLVLVGIAFLMIVMHVAPSAHFTQPHHVVGLISCALAFMQPLNAAFRNHVPKGKRSWLQFPALLARALRGDVDGTRPASLAQRVSATTSLVWRFAWEVWHKASGYGALLLAAINLFSGPLILIALGKGSAPVLYVTLVWFFFATLGWIAVFVVKGLSNFTVWRVYPERGRFCGVCCGAGYEFEAVEPAALVQQEAVTALGASAANEDRAGAVLQDNDGDETPVDPPRDDVKVAREHTRSLS
jgi:hypothetical protein